MIERISEIITQLLRLDSDEVGALHYAARYNHQAVMQLLVDFNASQFFNLL